VSAAEQKADLSTHRIEGIARMGNKPFSVPLFSHITGNLWTGGCPIQKAPENIIFIVSLYPWEPYEIHDHQMLTSIKLYDHGETPDETTLYILAKHVNECMAAGPTLVHCQAGLNRSALVAALALIIGGMVPAEAVKLLRDKRSDVVLCNEHFERWLLARTAG
jgi:protein-tyrosine phosphatase